MMHIFLLRSSEIPSRNDPAFLNASRIPSCLHGDSWSSSRRLACTDAARPKSIGPKHEPTAVDQHSSCHLATAHYFRHHLSTLRRDPVILVLFQRFHFFSRLVHLKSYRERGKGKSPPRRLHKAHCPFPQKNLAFMLVLTWAKAYINSVCPDSPQYRTLFALYSTSAPFGI